MFDSQARILNVGQAIQFYDFLERRYEENLAHAPDMGENLDV
jgi:hypothetical protein